MTSGLTAIIITAIICATMIALTIANNSAKRKK